MYYLVGDDAEIPRQHSCTAHQDFQYLHVDDLDSFLTSDANLGTVDVMEIFGGEGGVGHLAIRRRLKSGGNIDLVTGHDPLPKDVQEAV